MTATVDVAAAHGGSRSNAAHAFNRELGAWLRLHRELRGLSLPAVERMSRGRFLATTLRSYEAADRAIGPETLAALAGFYGVPVAELLPDQ